VRCRVGAFSAAFVMLIDAARAKVPSFIFVVVSGFFEELVFWWLVARSELTVWRSGPGMKKRGCEVYVVWCDVHRIYYC
jgi:hypothetical protein